MMKSNEAKLDKVVAGCGGSGSGMRALDRAVNAQLRGGRSTIRTARGRQQAVTRARELFGRTGTSQGNIRTRRGRR